MIYICMVNKNENLKELKLGNLLPVMESFYTIQGEGFYKGHAAYFIRTGGCNVGCHWCDVKESWNFKKHPLTDIKRLVKNAKKFCEIVVITGGEPLMWNMDPITKLIKQNNLKSHIETSGSNKLTGYWDWICLSPKKKKSPVEEIYQKADELKIIIFDEDDLIYAEEQSKKVSQKCILYLQPEWSKRNEVMPMVVDYVLKNIKWKVSLQTHKYLNIP